MKRLICVAMVALGMFSCGKSGTEPVLIIIPENKVDPNALVWAIGTMGGVKSIDLANDTVTRSVNLGFSMFNTVAVQGRFLYLGGGMEGGIKRVELLSSTTDTITKVTPPAGADMGSIRGLEGAAGRAWVIGNKRKTLFGMDTATNATNTIIELTGGADTGGCAGFCVVPGAIYVVTLRPTTLHKVDLTSLARTSSVVLDTAYDSIGVASVGFCAGSVYTLIGSRKEIVVTDAAASVVQRRMVVAALTKQTEKLCATPSGVYVTMRSSVETSVLNVNPQTGAVSARFTIRPSIENLTFAKTFGQRLLVVLSNGDFGQDAVIELNPVTMVSQRRVEHVYVSDIAVQR